eukprot:CAMPEP_0202726378 /NCGR_PEP_ID=MMETSP1385-20130828/184583_1 /ASSEMBLY_ACC=CAM_ASM_000861 /TAXON_ID=933848 /ORGANISM="Elphidium margaritaceum" /LENGTH=227 /DNA_ID=CAMNT_0049392597 /DNA_START=27 /DNA_END=709 /DNA_ORIENTATION=+
MSGAYGDTYDWNEDGGNQASGGGGVYSGGAYADEPAWANEPDPEIGNKQDDWHKGDPENPHHDDDTAKTKKSKNKNTKNTKKKEKDGKNKDKSKKDDDDENITVKKQLVVQSAIEKNTKKKEKDGKNKDKSKKKDDDENITVKKQLCCSKRNRGFLLFWFIVVLVITICIALMAEQLITVGAGLPVVLVGFVVLGVSSGVAEDANVGDDRSGINIELNKGFLMYVVI